jgi:hypothetical protein
VPSSLFQLPTRGSLAGDESWLAGLTRLDALADLPADRHVLFAGHLLDERVALVLGRGPGGAVAAWLIGPLGAPRQRMALAAPPAPAMASGPIALWDTPESAWLGGVLVVVALPGDPITFLAGRQADSSGRESDLRQQLPATDGVAIAAVGAPVIPHVGSAAAGRVVVDRAGSDVVVRPLLSDRARRLSDAPVEPADPRALRAGVDERQLQELLRELLATYGLRPRQLSPVLLAAGPVHGTDSAVLVGATMPSGATVAWLSVSGRDGDCVVGPLSTTPEPAGPALLDRVVAVRAPPSVPAPDGGPGTLVISAPREASVAEALAADGSTLARAPLADGAGVAAMPAESATIRVRDAHGSVLGEGPVGRLVGPAGDGTGRPPRARPPG